MALGRFIRKTLKSVIKWAVRDDENYTKSREDSPMPVSSGMISKGIGSSSIRDGANGMNFVVYSATGGKVIQFSTYDPRTDRSNTNLYVITDKEDLGEELGQIITKESLCR
jgi:hypothetical protein